MGGFGAGAAALALACVISCPAAAQEQATGTPAVESDWDFSLEPSEPSEPAAASGAQQRRGFRTAVQQPESERPRACAPDTDLLVAGAAGRPRYDENGALIRPTSTACEEPYSRTVAAANAAQTTMQANARSGVIVERESSGGCTEDRLTGTRTCTSSGSVTIGSSEEGNARTRQQVEDMLDRMERD